MVIAFHSMNCNIPDVESKGGNLQILKYSKKPIISNNLDSNNLESANYFGLPIFLRKNNRSLI